jgi:glycerophosphoryl diester phosphodiesterase
MPQSLAIFTLILVHMLFREPSAMIIAHRGASHDAPENTLAAVNLAWEKGADAVEVDVHLSRDNRIMVIHDADTKRTTGVRMVVRESLSETLRTLDASFGMADYRGERIPYLEEVIETVPEDKWLFIEVKTDTVILPYLSKLLEGHPKQSRLVVISFDFDVCTRMKRQIPDIPVYWLHNTLSGSYRSKWIEEAGAGGLDGLNFRYKGISRDYMEAVHRAGLKMFAWTVDEPDEAARLTRSGIDGITTNRPGWLREQLRQQGL